VKGAAQPYLGIGAIASYLRMTDQADRPNRVGSVEATDADVINRPVGLYPVVREMVDGVGFGAVGRRPMKWSSGPFQATNARSSSNGPGIPLRNVERKTGGRGVRHYQRDNLI